MMTDIPTKEEINKQKELIADFIIRFEQICAFIRFIILKVCYPNYTIIQNNNIETLLVGLTSDPLRKKLEALIYDNYSDDIELLALNKKLSDKFNKLIPIRNSFAHGSILLGWKSFDGELSSNTLLLKHSKTTKSGIDRNSMILNISELEDLTQKTKLIDNAYNYLYVLVDKNITERNRKLHLKNLEETIKKIGKIKLEFEEKVTK